MRIEKPSPCKINLLLNVLGRRADGFHELETVMQPVRIFDVLTFQHGSDGIQLECSDPALPADSRNLVHRAATAFLEAAGIKQGVRIRLEKTIPMAAGLGGGSGNAATTLLGLNELFGLSLPLERLEKIAAHLGSDVPFFLQTCPALATGRGEKIEPLRPFPALQNAVLLLLHPGFGTATPWAYQQLACFPEALNGRPGRARALVSLLNQSSLKNAGAEFYNSLEAPALKKFPILALFREFLLENGASAALMSGSGSATFGIFETAGLAGSVAEKFRAKFGPASWLRTAPL